MPQGYSRLIFEDNFSSLNKALWSLRGQSYTPGTMHAKGSWEAVKISAGKLRLLAKPVGENFLNGHIGTEGTFHFTYGYAEARMRVHPYLGSHSAFWLQSIHPYGENRPEIDVAEYFGVKNPARNTPTNLWNNIYYRDDDEQPLQHWKEHNEDTLKTRWSKDYYTYGLEWTPAGYKFFIDDQLVRSTFRGASTSEKYLVLSMLTRDYEVPNYQHDKADTYKLSVDWVRVWQ